MTATEVGYEQVRAWVKARVKQTHATVVQTIAWAVLCVLVAQRVTPAALARALPAEHAGQWAGTTDAGTPMVDRTVVDQAVVQSAADYWRVALLSPWQAVVVGPDHAWSTTGPVHHRRTRVSRARPLPAVLGWQRPRQGRWRDPLGYQHTQHRPAIVCTTVA